MTVEYNTGQWNTTHDSGIQHTAMEYNTWQWNATQGSGIQHRTVYYIYNT